MNWTNFLTPWGLALGTLFMLLVLFEAIDAGLNQQTLSARIQAMVRSTPKPVRRLIFFVGVLVGWLPTHLFGL